MQTAPVADTRTGVYWLAALPPSTYDAECAAIRAHGRTRQAVRNGEDVPEHVLDWFCHDPDDVECE